MILQTLNSINIRKVKCYWRLQVQTHHYFSYTIQVTPSYLVRTFEQDWERYESHSTKPGVQKRKINYPEEISAEWETLQ